MLICSYKIQPLLPNEYAIEVAEVPSAGIYSDRVCRDARAGTCVVLW